MFLFSNVGSVAGGGGGGSTLPEQGFILIPPGVVTADLTNFVHKVDLSLFPDDWWTAVDTNGVNIRVYHGSDDSVEVPCDIVVCDVGTKTGRLFFKADVATASNNLYWVKPISGGTAVSVSATYGRNNVWTDYHRVFIGEQVDRTGSGSNGTLHGNAVYTAGRLTLDGVNDWLGLAVTQYSTWSMAISGKPTSIVGIRTLMAYTDGTSDSNRTAIVQNAGSQWEFWNNSDGALAFASSVDPVSGREDRLNVTQNGTTDRKAYFNGGSVATDTGTVTRPGGAGDEINIGVATSAEGEDWVGDCDFIYLRSGVLTAAWIAAEFLSWITPASFYTVIVPVDFIMVAHKVFNTPNTTTITIPSIPFGIDNGTRSIIVAFGAENGSADDRTITSVDVGSITSAGIAVQNAATGSGNRSRTVVITDPVNPTGLSGDIVIHCSAGFDAVFMTVYRAYIPLATHDTDAASTTGSGSDASKAATVELTNGGYAVSIGVAWHDTNACSWTGFTETADDLIFHQGGVFNLSGGSAVYGPRGGGTGNVTATYTPNASTRCSCAAVSYNI